MHARCNFVQYLFFRYDILYLLSFGIRKVFVFWHPKGFRIFWILKVFVTPRYGVHTATVDGQGEGQRPVRRRSLLTPNTSPVSRGGFSYLCDFLAGRIFHRMQIGGEMDCTKESVPFVEDDDDDTLST